MMFRAADFAGVEKTGEIERLDKTCFIQSAVEKARTAFSTLCQVVMAK